MTNWNLGADDVQPGELIEAIKTCDYANLLDRYVRVLKQVYALPTLFLLVPPFRSSRFWIARRRILPIPTVIVTALLKRHIRERLSRINQHLNVELLCLESPDNPRCEFNKAVFERTLTQANEVEQSLAAQRTSGWIAVFIALIALAFILRLEPLAVNTQTSLLQVATSALSADIVGFLNSGSQALSGLQQALNASGGSYHVSSLAASLLPAVSLSYLLHWFVPPVIVLLPITLAFRAKRWILNHPYEQLRNGYSFTPISQDTLRGEIYALEEHTFGTLHIKKPAELPLDLFVYCYFSGAFLLAGVLYLWKLAPNYYSYSTAYLLFNVIIAAILIASSAFFSKGEAPHVRRRSSLIFLFVVLTIIPLFLDSILNSFFNIQTMLSLTSSQSETVKGFAFGLWVLMTAGVSAAYVFIAAGTRIKRKKFTVIVGLCAAIPLSAALAMIISPALADTAEYIWVYFYFAVSVLFVLIILLAILPWHLIQRLRRRSNDNTFLLALFGGLWIVNSWFIVVYALPFIPLFFLYLGVWIAWITISCTRERYNLSVG